MDTTSELERVLAKLDLTSESEEQRFREMYACVFGPSAGGSSPTSSSSSESEADRGDPAITAFRTAFRNHIRRIPYVYMCQGSFVRAKEKAEVAYSKMTTLPLPAELEKEQYWIFSVNFERRLAFFNSSLDGALDDFRAQLGRTYPLEELQTYEESELQAFCNELKAEIGDEFSENLNFMGGPLPQLEGEWDAKMSVVVKETMEKNRRNAKAARKLNQAADQYKAEMSKFLCQNPFATKEQVESAHVQVKNKCEVEEPALLAKALKEDPVLKLEWDSKIDEELRKQREEANWMEEGDRLMEALREGLKSFCLDTVKERYNLALDAAGLEDIFTAEFLRVMRRILEKAEPCNHLVEAEEEEEHSIPTTIRGATATAPGSSNTKPKRSKKKKKVSSCKE